MSITQSYNYTWDGQITNDFILKPIVTGADLQKLFNVKTGIKNKWQIPLAVANEDVIRQYDGNCGTPTAVSVGTLSNRTLQLEEVAVSLATCKDVFENQLTEDWLRTGATIGDIGGTEAEKLIISLLEKGVNRSLRRQLAFGSRLSTNTALNGITGLWTRLIAGVADSYCVDRVDNIATLNTTSGTRAVDYLENLYKGADTLLRQIDAAKKAFFVTVNIWDNYRLYLQTTNAASIGTLQLENGVTKLYYQGIEVVPMYDWSQDIASYSLGNASRILYTTLDNHWIGVSAAADQGQIEGWFEKKENKYYHRMQFKLGYQYAHCDLQAVSYGAAS